jgi:acetylornithine deacetylase/succinyl-diaminopimelate desuccinylase-like protein
LRVIVSEKKLDNKIDKTLSLVEKNRILEIAQEFIKIRSFTGEETQIIEYAKDLFEDNGLKTEIHGSKERPNLISILNPRKEPYLVFNAHLDTKPIIDKDEWLTDPFSPIIKDGILYGRGASDCKAPCAVLFHILEILHQLDLDCAIGVQLVCDEEMGGKYGTKLLVNEMLEGSLRKPDYVIVGEKSNLKLRIAQRGKFEFSIRFKGTPSHKSRYVKANSISKAAKGVLAIQKKIDKYHPWIGNALRNVTSINASSPTGIPSECVVDVYRGLLIGESPETVITEIRDALNEAGDGDTDWNWDLDAQVDDQGKFIYLPPNYTPPDNKLVKTMYNSIKLVLGKEAELFNEYAGQNDGRFYRQLGIPTVSYGAIGGNHHSPNEFVEINSLKKLAKIYIATALLIEKTNYQNLKNQLEPS